MRFSSKKFIVSILVSAALLKGCVKGLSLPSLSRKGFDPCSGVNNNNNNNSDNGAVASSGTSVWPSKDSFRSFGKVRCCAIFAASLCLAVAAPNSLAIDDGGATSMANAKITTGGASTLQSGRTIAITRGVNLDRTDFSNQNLKGVAFQQSIVRDANFQNSNLVSASFFDATVDGSNFENADLSQANFEMAQLNRASLKNAVVRDMYVSGSTLFEGIKTIENSDWTDTYLRKDQQKYLCAHPTAKGTNPKTGVDTRESLMCID